jgi:hypothetical protein
LLRDYQAIYGDTFEDDLQNAITLDQMGVLSPTLDNHLQNALYKDPTTGEMIGYFEPFALPETDIQKRLRSPIPFDTLTDIYNSLDGTTIEEQEE